MQDLSKGEIAEMVPVGASALQRTYHGGQSAPSDKSHNSYDESKVTQLKTYNPPLVRKQATTR